MLCTLDTFSYTACAYALNTYEYIDVGGGAGRGVGVGQCVTVGHSYCKGCDFLVFWWKLPFHLPEVCGKVESFLLPSSPSQLAIPTLKLAGI